MYSVGGFRGVQLLRAFGNCTVGCASLSASGSSTRVPLTPSRHLRLRRAWSPVCCENALTNCSTWNRSRHLHTCLSPAGSPAATSIDPDDRMIATARRVPRKRRPLTAAYDSQPFSGPAVVAVALADSFDVSSIVKDIPLCSMYQITFVDEESEEGVHFVPKPQYVIDKKAIRDFFVFADGVLVFWGVESAERAQVIRFLEEYTTGRYDPRTVESEMDTMRFCITNEGKTKILRDQLLLNVAKYETGHSSSLSILERYGFSHGMAASVKVAIWESELSEQAEPLSITTKALSKGIIPWKRKEALRKIGEFSVLRHSINLNCNLLNTDFYWERADLEEFYLMALRHFSVKRRIVELNNRLDYCEGLVKLIDGILTHRHASKLEWMIIVLIVIEVFFDIFHFMDTSPKTVVVYKPSDADA